MSAIQSKKPSAASAELAPQPTGRDWRQPEHWAAVCRGEEAAIAQFYEAHVDDLYALLFYRLGKDPDLAEELVAETFSRALATPTAFDPSRGSPLAWLGWLSRNLMRSEQRYQSRGQQSSLLQHTLSQVYDALVEGPLSDELIARAETRALVQMTIERLSGRDRSLLTTKYIEGESLASMAAANQSSIDAIKSRLARARKAFKQAFLKLCQNLQEPTPQGESHD